MPEYNIYFEQPFPKFLPSLFWFPPNNTMENCVFQDSLFLCVTFVLASTQATFI